MRFRRRSPRTVVHVNQHVIRANQRRNERQPPLIVRSYHGTIRANRVSLRDSSGIVMAQVVYSPDAPLACGARVWIELGSGVDAVCEDSDGRRGDEETPAERG